MMIKHVRSVAGIRELLEVAPDFQVLNSRLLSDDSPIDGILTMVVT